MGLEVGAVLEGKVTGITKFGAFVALPENKSGLVHISEVANSYVNDVHDYLEIGQTVKVRVLSIRDGKINLSIKQAEAPQSGGRERQNARPQNTRPQNAGAQNAGGYNQPRGGRNTAPVRSYAPVPAANEPSADKSFEDRLKKFMQESDSRIADNRIYAEHRSRSRRK